jgi:hypothetical protein
MSILGNLVGGFPLVPDMEAEVEIGKMLTKPISPSLALR